MPRYVKKTETGKPKLIATATNVFSVWCSLEPGQRNKSYLLKALDEYYEHNVSMKDLNRWMAQTDWVKRAEDMDKKTMDALAEVIVEQKQLILRPMMEQMLTIESLGWAKLVRAVEEMPQAMLSQDIRSFKGFADTVMNISKMRIVQEGGVSDRVSHEVRRLSDDELLAEMEKLSAELSGVAVRDDAEDAEYDVLQDLEKWDAK